MTRWAWLGFAVLASVAVASVLVSSGSRRPLGPRATVVAPSVLPAAEAAYYEALAPRLDRAVLDADALVEIGARRSRNLLEIRAAQDRMDASLVAVDLLLDNRPPPALFASSAASYRDGAEALREAMAEAQSGFLRFDWERVAAAYDRAGGGARALHRAAHQLVAAAGRNETATPASLPAGAEAADPE